MAETAFLFDFSFAAQPGGNWPAIVGRTDDEVGDPAGGAGEQSSARAAAYIENYMWQVD